MHSNTKPTESTTERSSRRILGIDPGSRLTGFACIEMHGRKLQVLEHGTYRLERNAPRGEKASFDDRLLCLFQDLEETIRKWKPDILAVEKVFFAKNAVSALKLGQARGVVIVAGAIHSLKFFEYSTTEVKQAIVGYGRAEKEQVAKMLKLMVGPQEFDTPDASDALALAVCHAHLSLRPQSATQLPKKSKKRVSLAEALGFTESNHDRINTRNLTRNR